MKVNGTPKMLTYSAAKRPVLGSTSYEVRWRPRPTSESAQPHDVRHGLGVPAFREHPDGDDSLNLLTRFSHLANGIDGFAKLFGAFLPGQFLDGRFRIFLRILYRGVQFNFRWFFLGFCFSQNFGIDMQDAFGVA